MLSPLSLAHSVNFCLNLFKSQRINAALLGLSLDSGQFRRDLHDGL